MIGSSKSMDMKTLGLMNFVAISIEDPISKINTLKDDIRMIGPYNTVSMVVYSKVLLYHEILNGNRNFCSIVRVLRLITDKRPI
jgi:hypothetical protein